MRHEIDVRTAANRASAKRTDALHAIAERVSDNLPGKHRIKITAFSASSGNPSSIESRGARADIGNWLQHATDHVRAISPALGLTEAQAPEFLTIDHVAETSGGARAVHLHQLYKGISIFQAALVVRYDPAGNLIDTVGHTVSVEHDLSAEPALSAQEAALRAAQHVASSPVSEAIDQHGDLPQRLDLRGFEPTVQTEKGGSERWTTLDAGALGGPITASLVWFDHGDRLLLAWNVSLVLPQHASHYVALVDAHGGEILYCRLLVSAVAAQGNVFRDGDAARQMMAFPRPRTDYAAMGFQFDADLPANFPDEWVANNATAGNAIVAGAMVGNVLTGIVGNEQNNVMTFSPDVSANVNLGIVNLFYYCNLMHDVFYLLGFREGSGNFQSSNLGRPGGVDGDPVTVVYYPGLFPQNFPVQHGAFMRGAQEPDGTGATMYAGVIASTGRHTAFDPTLIYHEYMHGVTGRLVGTPAVRNALMAPQSAALGEGWSDFAACLLTDKVVIGSWAANYNLGIRTWPYLPNYPGHFGKLGVGVWANVPETLGGQGFYPAGEIWCAALMDMARNFGLSVYFPLRLVVDALKLTPANPTFIQARDAIFRALDSVNQPGVTSDVLAQAMWAAFCKYGLGYGAYSDTTFETAHPGFRAPANSAWKCQKCSGLISYFSPDRPSSVSYRCPEGGTHRIASTAEYELWDGPGFSPGELKACTKCRAIVLASQLGQAHCPAGDFHSASANIYHVVAAPATGEADWWRCSNCQGLFAGTDGLAKACPNGGQHDKDASKEYCLLPRATEPPRLLLAAAAAPADEWSALALDTSGFLTTVSHSIATTAGSDATRQPGWRPSVDIVGSDGARVFFSDAKDGYGYYIWKKDSQGNGAWNWTGIGLPAAGIKTVVGATDDATIVVVIGNDGQLWWGSTPQLNPGLWTWAKIELSAGSSPAFPILAPVGIRVQTAYTNIVTFDVLVIMADSRAWRIQMNPLPTSWPFTRTWSWSDQGAPTTTLVNAIGVNAVRPTVFGAGADGHAWQGAWDNTTKQWSWLDGGAPSSGNVAATVAVADNGAGASFRGSDGHLQLWRKDGGWSDLGAPPAGKSIVRGLGMTAAGWKSLLLYGDGQLHLAELDGSTGRWTDIGAPGNWTLFPAPDKWTLRPGAAFDIGVGGDGSVWVVGTKHVGDQSDQDFSIYRWNATTSDWDFMGGAGERIAVKPDGNAWAFGGKDGIFVWSSSWSGHTLPSDSTRGLDGRWQGGRDIGIGANGSVWLVGPRQVAGGYATYRLNASDGWDDMDGNAVRIAVEPRGNPWIVDDQGRIARWTGELWMTMPGLAKDIAVGNEGSVWITLLSGQGVAKWTADGWLSVPIVDAEQIAVDPNGLPWVVNKQNQILQRIA